MALIQVSVKYDNLPSLFTWALGDCLKTSLEKGRCCGFVKSILVPAEIPTAGEVHPFVFFQCMLQSSDI